MTDALTCLRTTSMTKHLIVVRILAGGPLLLFGAMHLSGSMPMAPLLEAAGIPMASINAIIAPIMEVLAGLLLLSGAFARVGGVLAVMTMLGALYTHIKIPSDGWPEANGGPQEPQFMMVIATIALLGGAYVALRGGGAWSVDLKSTTDSSPAPA